MIYKEIASDVPIKSGQFIFVGNSYLEIQGGGFLFVLTDNQKFTLYVSSLMSCGCKRYVKVPEDIEVRVTASGRLAWVHLPIEWNGKKVKVTLLED